MRKRFRNASMNLFILRPKILLRYQLERATRCGDLFLGGGAEGMRVNRDLGGQLAIAENLYAIAAAANESVRTQQLRRNGFARRKNVQFFQVQDRIFDAERVVKAALGHAAMQRHLAAFKSAAARIAAAGFLSLVAGTGSLAELGAHAAANAHLAMTRANGRTQIRETRESER